MIERIYSKRKDMGREEKFGKCKRVSRGVREGVRGRGQRNKKTGERKQ